MACDCCTGTDCAPYCVGGFCPAEEQQRQFDEERARQEEEAYEAYADLTEAFEAIAALGRWAFGLPELTDEEVPF